MRVLCMIQLRTVTEGLAAVLYDSVHSAQFFVIEVAAACTTLSVYSVPFFFDLYCDRTAFGVTRSECGCRSVEFLSLLCARPYAFERCFVVGGRDGMTGTA